MNDEEKKIDDPKEEDFSAKFKDEQGLSYDIKLNVPVVHEFCRQQNLQVGCFTPAGLNMAQYIDLAFAGTRWNSRYNLGKQSKKQFLEAIDGPSYQDVMGAAMNAIVNFTLHTAPKEKRQMMVETVKKSLKEAETVLVGLGEESSKSPQPPELTP